MKLANLNGAIRKFKGAPKLWWRTPTGPILLCIQKTELLASLATLHNGDRNAETGLSMRDTDGLITSEDPKFAPPDPNYVAEWSKAHDAAIKREAVGHVEDDDEDLLGDTFTPEESGEDDELEDLL